MDVPNAHKFSGPHAAWNLRLPPDFFNHYSERMERRSFFAK